MPIIEIENVGRVEVGDEFMSLSPEQQAETVDEIAASQSQQTQPARSVEASTAPTLESPGPSDGALGASTRGIAQGATLGFSDEILAGVAAPFRAAARAIVGKDDGQGVLDRLGAAFNLELENQRNLLDASQAQNPVASTVGEIAGGAVAGGGLSRAGTTLLGASKPTATSLATRGAGEGAAFAGAFGFGTGEGFEDRFDRAKSGAAAGAVTGGVVGGVAGRVATRKAQKTIQTVEKLKTARDGAYQAAEQAGEVVPQARLGAFAQRLSQNMQKRGINLGQHPKSAGALDAFVKNANQDMSLSNVDLLRRNFLDAAMSNDASEARLAGIMLNRLDEFIDTVPGGPLWRDARKAHKQFRKSATVERLIERAKLRAEQFSNSGMDNALQTEFRQFVRNDKLLKGFTKAERAALDAVAKNGVTATVFRKIGKLAPSSGVMANMFGLLTASVNLPLAVGFMVAGEAGKQTARAIRTASARRASRLVRAGGDVPTAPRLTGPQRTGVGGGLAALAEQSSALVNR